MWLFSTDGWLFFIRSFFGWRSGTGRWISFYMNVRTKIRFSGILLSAFEQSDTMVNGNNNGRPKISIIYVICGSYGSIYTNTHACIQVCSHSTIIQKETLFSFFRSVYIIKILFFIILFPVLVIGSSLDSNEDCAFVCGFFLLLLHVEETFSTQNQLFCASKILDAVFHDTAATSAEISIFISDTTRITAAATATANV